MSVAVGVKLNLGVYDNEFDRELVGVCEDEREYDRDTVCSLLCAPVALPDREKEAVLLQ